MSDVLTEQKLYEAALRYLERYASSQQHLKTVLARRVKRWELRTKEVAPTEVAQWITNAVQKCVDKNYLNDERYAEEKIVSLRRQGRSRVYILRALQLKGVNAATVKRFLGYEPEDELNAARRYAERRRLGKKRDDEGRQKDLAKLVRAGFALDVARKVLGAK